MSNLLDQYNDILMEGFAPAEVDGTFRVQAKVHDSDVAIYDQYDNVARGRSEGDEITLRVRFLGESRETEYYGTFHKVGKVCSICHMVEIVNAPDYAPSIVNFQSWANGCVVGCAGSCTGGCADGCTGGCAGGCEGTSIGSSNHITMTVSVHTDGGA